MPESEGPERRRDVERALDRLAAAVDRVTVEVEGSRQRAAGAEEEYAQLREVVSGTGGEAPLDLEARLGPLAEENRVLRETLLRARERAERLRSRLSVVEDEV